MLNIRAFASSSKGNMYVVENEDTKLLLECGVPKDQIKKYLRSQHLIITDLQACLISHRHSDHALSLDYVLEYLPVFSTYELYERNNSVVPLKPFKSFKIGSIMIMPIPVEHGSTENNAFIFMDKESSIFWATDFTLMESNVSSIPFDKVYIEANYDDDSLQEILDNEGQDNYQKFVRQCSTHMSRENCKTHLHRMNLSKCKEIVLLHASEFLISHIKTKEEFEREFHIKTYFAKEK